MATTYNLHVWRNEIPEEASREHGKKVKNKTLKDRVKQIVDRDKATPGYDRNHATEGLVKILENHDENHDVDIKVMDEPLDPLKAVLQIVVP